MARYDIPTHALAPGGPTRNRTTPARPRFHLWLAALPALAAVTWWLWPEPPPSPNQVPVYTAPIQAARSGQAWPFGSGPAPAVVTSVEAESPWDRLSKVVEVEAVPGPDPRTLNAAISPARLSFNHPKRAQAFLDHVVLQPEQRGGFVVDSVLPGSVYERAGLKAGDTVYSLDLPDQPVVDENNMIALTSVQVLAFEVVRYGAPLRLSAPYNAEAPTRATP